MQIPRSNTEPQKDQVSGARFTYQNMKAKLFAALVECLVIIWHLATFILSRLVYNYVWNENEKDTFDIWADYLHRFPAYLIISLFVGSINTYFASKRNEVPNILPETRTLMVLFENALEDVSGRHDLLIKFSRYTLLTWLLTMRQFSKQLKTKFPNYMLIQEVLHLTDMERQALEKFEKVNQPMSQAPVEWLRAMVIQMEISHSLKPGEKKILFEAVCKLEQKCDDVRKFSERETVNVRFRRVSCFALHAFGWLSVLGMKNGIGYFLSPHAIAYYCMYLANDIHRVNAFSFDDFGYQMTEIFEQKMYDHKFFLEIYHLNEYGRLMYDPK